jgi:hypothetical protein
MTDGTIFWIDSYSSDDKNVIKTYTVYSDNKCTTVVAVSQQNIPKTCQDQSYPQDDDSQQPVVVPFSLKIDAGTGTPKKEYNVLLSKNYYSAVCAGPVTSINTSPLDNCASDVDNGVTMSMKISCHNSTHYKREMYNGDSCSGTATTAYLSLGCESYGSDESSNYECVPYDIYNKGPSPSPTISSTNPKPRKPTRMPTRGATHSPSRKPSRKPTRTTQSPSRKPVSKPKPKPKPVPKPASKPTKNL